MPDDPIVAEVRRVRDGLARKHNYDVQAICEDLMRRQGKTVTIEELRTGAGAATPSPYSAHAAEPLHVREGK
ncbi:MAG: hypothetical protein FJ279_34640 [Planctomycetes bacterium]|nr:hypothetical protein [Planctomycetota bacterium]MBM4087536.1 hypothetical protein [Planctomycetota bacterium]